MIPRKQNSTQEDWVEAVRAIYAQPDHARAEALIRQGRQRIERRLRGVRNPAMAWSSGKDSLGIEVLVEGMGLPSFITLTALEFPALERVVARTAPPDLHIQRQSHLDMEWLSKHPHVLFPRTSAQSNSWMERVQRDGNRKACHRHGFDLAITGHRTKDGNHVGRIDPQTGGERPDRGGRFVHFTPIVDWSHEDLFHVLAHAGKELPEFYFWPKGFHRGNGSWARRRVPTVEQGWLEVDQIDPDVVDHACVWNIKGAVQHRRQHPRETDQ